MKTNQILIVNQHPKSRISRPYLKKNVSQILSLLKLPKAKVEITLVDDRFMKKQNLLAMGKKGTTDVLSFPQIAVSSRADRGSSKIFDGELLGDILVSLDQAKRQAEEQKVATRKEVLFLVLHSILHLVGYDHATPKDELEMHELESKVWMKLNYK